MTVIELPDDQAAALRARAAAQGLTLEGWFEKLSRAELPVDQSRPQKSRPLSAEDRAWMDAPAIGREA
jgi:hypothetical protein